MKRMKNEKKNSCFFCLVCVCRVLVQILRNQKFLFVVKCTGGNDPFFFFFFNQNQDFKLSWVDYGAQFYLKGSTKNKEKMLFIGWLEPLLFDLQLLMNWNIGMENFAT